MAVDLFPWAIDGNTHPAAGARVMTCALLGGDSANLNPTTVAYVDGAHGIAASGDFAVSQNGTPNMSVNVANGSAFVRSGWANNQSYHVRNGTGTVNVAVSAADATNARWDLVILEVRDSNFSGANDDARLVVVAGTPAASPADPSLAAYPNCLVLARLVVPALDTTIGNAQITDLRKRCHNNDPWVCTSTTRPTANLYAGLMIYETDTGRVLVYSGSAWSTIGPVHGALTSWTPTVTQSGALTATNVYSRYQRIGRKITGWFSVSIGAGSGTGGQPVIIGGLPFTAAASGFSVGSGQLYDASAPAAYVANVHLESTTTFSLRVSAASGDNRLGVAGFTAGLANSPDLINGKFEYEAAADA